VAGAALRYPDGSPQWSGGHEPTLLWLFGVASGLPALLARIPGYRALRPVSGGAGGSVDWVTGAAMAIRRATWQEVGPFDPRFRFYAQDLDFCLRAKDARWKVALVPAFRVMHVGGATIGKRTGGKGHAADKGLLGSDLLAWAERRHGPGWAMRARKALALGNYFRSRSNATSD
jgi:GT2 family glycosyltransferase